MELVGHLWVINGFNLYFKPEPKQTLEDVSGISRQFKRSMLFLHAILGWDITSCFYGIGKAAALKKYANSVHFSQQVKVLDLHSQFHGWYCDSR